MLEIGGGAPGERTASLYAACARPFQTAFSEPSYRDPYERAAALSSRHHLRPPFVDGNKRTGTVACLLLLSAEIEMPEFQAEAYLRLRLLGEVALATASGYLDVNQIDFWLRRFFSAQG